MTNYEFEDFKDIFFELDISEFCELKIQKLVAHGYASSFIGVYSDGVNSHSNTDANPQFTIEDFDKVKEKDYLITLTCFNDNLFHQYMEDGLLNKKSWTQVDSNV